jgi:hypothetical protein
MRFLFILLVIIFVVMGLYTGNNNWYIGAILFHMSFITTAIDQLKNRRNNL